MESPHDFDAVHWDHEPVWVVPSVWCPAFRRPGPAKAGTPNRRFMESPHDFDTVHWDHEPVWVVPSVCCPAFRRPGPAKAGTPNRRFMESPLGLTTAHRDHEPVRIPLNRPSGTFSPTGGEEWDEGARFMESLLRFFACIGTMNPPLTPPGRGTDMARTNARPPPVGQFPSWAGSGVG